MSVIHIRDILAFPEGANATDTTFGGGHFNLTVLNYWNYTLFTNGTLSNGSSCFLAIEPWAPAQLLNNGTFVNSTSCYSPIDGLGTRSGIGIGMGVLFAFCLIGILINLAKHGKLHLPAEKRFVPIGRRWQWYWGIFTVVTAFVSLFTNVDVDRFRVVGLPLILNSFFWFLMQQGTMAVVWEAVRHWGSWQERQFIDPDPFTLRDDDRRAKVEFFLPLIFYLWVWINFFLIVPRNWGAIAEQRSPDQTAVRAAPAATDLRFKLAALFLLLAWLTIVASLLHSIKHYKIRRHGLVHQFSGYVGAIPIRFLLLLPLALIVVAYQALVSFSWANSVLNVKSNLGAMYAGGYGPALAILVVQLAWGYMTPNEDIQLKRLRRQRGEAMDREMGIVQKPNWWRRVKDTAGPDRNNLGGGRPTANGVRDNWGREGREDPSTVEMANMPGSPAARRTSQVGLFDASKLSTFPTYTGKSDRRRTEVAMSTAGAMLFPTVPGQPSAAQVHEAHRREIMQDGPAPPPYSEREQAQRGRAAPASASGEPAEPGRPLGSERSTSTGTGVSSRQPQQIRSMLDV